MYCTCRCNGSQLAMKPDIGSESRLLPTPPAFDAPIRGFPVRILPCRLVRKKVEWLGYPTVKKFWRYVYWFWHNPRTWQTDTHTDGQTDTAWRQRPRLHSIARQKLADAVKSHLNWRLWQALLHCWQDKWRVRSSVDVTVTSTFVSGPTAHRWLSLQLKQLVNNETVLSCRESLTVTFSPSCNSFVMLRVTCYTDKDFGSMPEQLASVLAFTGLTTLGLQASLFEYFDICHFYTWASDKRV